MSTKHTVRETLVDSPAAMSARGYRLLGEFRDEHHFRAADWLLDTELVEVVATTGDKYRVWEPPHAIDVGKWFFGAKDKVTGRVFIADYVRAENFDRAVELAKQKAREALDEVEPDGTSRSFELTAVCTQTPSTHVDLGFHIAEFIGGRET